MNVLSLFDGKSSGYTALELAGKPITNYYSSEVDKYAIQVSEAIHPNQTRLGDVTKWRDWDIDLGSIDLVIAGSPCQGFSFAGKQLAFNDPRSKLFFVFVDILNHVKSLNPSVKFLLENVKMKKEYMDVIDEQLGVESIMINSALVSAQNRKRSYWTNIPTEEPLDRNILLSQILENIDDLNGAGVLYRDKSKCLRVGGRSSPIGDRHELDSPYCLIRGRGNNKGGVRGVDGKTPCVTSSSWQENCFVVNGFGIRRFSVRECFRLQTTPEHYIDKILSCGVPNSQLYKIAGNGWTDEVIAHIFTGLTT